MREKQSTDFTDWHGLRGLFETGFTGLTGLGLTGFVGEIVDVEIGRTWRKVGLEGGGNQWDRFAIRFSLPTEQPLYLVDIIYP